MRIVLALVFSLLCSAALASEWVVERVRGDALRLEGGTWTSLAIGEVIETGDRLQTGPNGRLTLARGAETIELGTLTQVQIHDDSVQRITMVAQQSGQVLVDVERRNVQHFSVQTPYMAAVVKGTRFLVTVSGQAADVSVERGEVQVQDPDNQLFVNVGAGESAAVAADAPLSVTSGNAVIYNMDGTPQTAEERSRPNEAASGQGNGPPPHANAGGNGNGAENRNGPPDHSNAGGNGNGNGNSHGNGGSNNGNGNGSGGGNGNGGGQGSSGNASGHDNQGNGSGPPEHSNAGGNGNGNDPPSHSNAGGNH